MAWGYFWKNLWQALTSSSTRPPQTCLCQLKTTLATGCNQPKICPDHMCHQSLQLLPLSPSSPSPFDLWGCLACSCFLDYSSFFWSFSRGTEEGPGLLPQEQRPRNTIAGRQQGGGLTWPSCSVPGSALYPAAANSSSNSAAQHVLYEPVHGCIQLITQLQWVLDNA